MSNLDSLNEALKALSDTIENAGKLNINEIVLARSLAAGYAPILNSRCEPSYVHILGEAFTACFTNRRTFAVVEARRFLADYKRLAGGESKRASAFMIGIVGNPQTKPESRLRSLLEYRAKLLQGREEFPVTHESQLIWLLVQSIATAEFPMLKDGLHGGE